MLQEMADTAVSLLPSTHIKSPNLTTALHTLLGVYSIIFNCMISETAFYWFWVTVCQLQLANDSELHHRVHMYYLYMWGLNVGTERHSYIHVMSGWHLQVPYTNHYSHPTLWSFYYCSLHTRRQFPLKSRHLTIEPLENFAQSPVECYQASICSKGRWDQATWSACQNLMGRLEVLSSSQPTHPWSTDWKLLQNRSIYIAGYGGCTWFSTMWFRIKLSNKEAFNPPSQNSHVYHTLEPFVMMISLDFLNTKNTLPDQNFEV